MAEITDLWPDTIEAATVVQQRLRAAVRLEDEPALPRMIAGVDVSYDIASNLTRAFIVLLPIDTLKPIESVRAEVPTTFPYVPGFLSFREIPAILAALPKLSQPFDLLMVDGQGVAHPRRLGIAAHLACCWTGRRSGSPNPGWSAVTTSLARRQAAMCHCWIAANGSAQCCAARPAVTRYSSPPGIGSARIARWR